MFLNLMLCAILVFFSILIFCRNTSSKSQIKNMSQLPGPRALPIIGHLHHLRAPLHHTFHNLAAKYGPLFYLSVGRMQALVITSPEVAKEFLKDHDMEFAARNKNFAIQRLTYDASFTFTTYGKYWKVLRKLCASEFLGNRAVSQFLHVRVDETKCFLRYLLGKAKLGEQINFSKEVTKLTSNILSRMMGVRGSGTKEESEQALILQDVAQIFGESNLADVFPIFKYFDVQGIKKRCDEIYQRYESMIEDILIKREESRRKKRELGEDNNGGKDFLDILYDVVEDDNAEIKSSTNHIKGLVLDFLTAGTDTPATSLDWTLAELINNPKIMKKAQEEIDRVVGKQRLVTESDSPNLPYIQAIIKETLRLHPPIAFYTRKAIQECVVMGIRIPVDTILFINIFSLGRDPNHWDNPLEFKPERFLNNDATSLKDVKGQDFELMPFGTGRRGCPGLTLALQEIHTILAAAIQCFDWKVTNNNGVVEMDERVGISAPRARDLLCLPIARINNLETIINQ